MASQIGKSGFARIELILMKSGSATPHPPKSFLFSLYEKWDRRKSDPVLDPLSDVDCTELLAGIEILYVGLVNNGFTAAQVAVINAYVAGGGGLVAVGTERQCCFGPSFEQIANSFGLFGLGGDRDAKANPSAPGSPIVNGPFGVATSYLPAATGAFKTPLPAGATSVWEGVDNNPIIVTLNVTGRAFFFADTNFMENGIITGGSNATIWGNAFAFSGNVGAVPEPETYAMMLAGLGAIGFAARRRRS